jgi:uncharacterized membrane protein YadS
LNWRIPPELRATANSIFNFMFRMSFAAIGPLIGFSIDFFGMRPTLYGIAATCLLLCLVFTLPLSRRIRQVKF